MHVHMLAMHAGMCTFVTFVNLVTFVTLGLVFLGTKNLGLVFLGVTKNLGSFLGTFVFLGSAFVFLGLVYELDDVDAPDMHMYA